MHYHLANDQPQFWDRGRWLGLACLAVLVFLLLKVWLPYGVALANATAIKFLPPSWAESYIAATLPNTATVQTGNRLIIETSTLHINAPIIESAEQKDLLRGVGHDPVSAIPGSQGWVVISGHRFWPDASPWATIFFSLDRLKVGDRVALLYNGQTYHYTVKERWAVPKDKAIPRLGPTTMPMLTLYTCGPNPYSNKERLGFDALLDESKSQQQAPKVIETLQDGVL